jgi:hypothetical protein
MQIQVLTASIDVESPSLEAVNRLWDRIGQHCGDWLSYIGK